MIKSENVVGPFTILPHKIWRIFGVKSEVGSFTSKNRGRRAQTPILCQSHFIANIVTITMKLLTQVGLGEPVSTVKRGADTGSRDFPIFILSSFTISKNFFPAIYQRL